MRCVGQAHRTGVRGGGVHRQGVPRSSGEGNFLEHRAGSITLAPSRACPQFSQPLPAPVLCSLRLRTEDGARGRCPPLAVTLQLGKPHANPHTQLPPPKRSPGEKFSLDTKFLQDLVTRVKSKWSSYPSCASKLEFALLQSSTGTSLLEIWAGRCVTV